MTITNPAVPPPLAAAYDFPKTRWPHEINEGEILSLILDHTRDGERQLGFNLTGSGGYLIRVAESFRWCLARIHELEASQQNEHTAVGRIVADHPVHGWHFSPYVDWETIGANTVLYAKSVAETEPIGYMSEHGLKYLKNNATSYLVPEGMRDEEENIPVYLGASK